MSRRKLLLPILLGVLLTVLFFLISMPLSKSGSGVPTIIFFPYASVFSLFLINYPAPVTFVLAYALFFLQYPLYGAILGNALGSSGFYKRLLILVALHVLLVAVCLRVYYL